MTNSLMDRKMAPKGSPFMPPRWALTVFLLIVAMTGHARPAQATGPDIHHSDTPLALVGEPARFVIFSHSGFCGEGFCRESYFFMLDIKAETVERLHVMQNPRQDWDGERDIKSEIERYLTTVPSEIAAMPVRSLDGLERMHFHRESEGLQMFESPLLPPAGLKHFRPVLRENSRVPSMKDGAVIGEEYRSCYDEDRENPYLCDGCRGSSRTLDGATFETHVCRRPPPDSDCDCTATAVIMRFVLVDVKKGTRFLGNRLFLSPQTLSQWSMYYEDEELERLELGITDLTAIVLPDAYLFVGSAVHAWGANTTYLPLIALVPREP